MKAKPKTHVQLLGVANQVFENTAPIKDRARELAKLETGLARDYFASRTNTRLFKLQAASDVSTIVGSLVMSTTPVLGNILNAVNAVTDLGTAIERTRAKLRHDPAADVKSLVTDWASFGIDLLGIVFPPAQWAQVGVIGLDGIQMYRYLAKRPPDPDEP